jgi:hypothetical protein
MLSHFCPYQLLLSTLTSVKFNINLIYKVCFGFRNFPIILKFSKFERSWLNLPPNLKTDLMIYFLKERTTEQIFVGHLVERQNVKTRKQNFRYKILLNTMPRQIQDGSGLD